MASEIVLIVTEQRNRQRILLPAAKAPCSFGRGPRCDYVLRRNNVGDRQFTLEYADGAWQLRDDAGGFATWYNNRYLRPGERCPLQEGDVIGLNTDGNDATQEITFRVQEIRAAADVGGLRAEAEDDPVLREIDLRRKRRVLIGRGEDCDVQLASDRVSRHRCEDHLPGRPRRTEGPGLHQRHLPQRPAGAHRPSARRRPHNAPTQVFAYAGGVLHYHEHQQGISVQLINLRKTVRERSTGSPLDIVDGVSMEIEPNSFVVLVGGSGAGKSSLLTCITGTAPCTGGSVCFDGIDTHGNRNAFDAVVGYVPQKDILHENLTVEQSLLCAARLRIAHDATRGELKAAVAHAIAAVDLQGREKTMIANLSGGQKKRVSIAMELLASPRLLVLDEPTSGLSPDLDRSMMELCRKLSHENCTVFMVTHNMSNINLCDRIAFLGVGGVLCYYGPPETLDDYFGVALTSDIFEKLRDPEQIEHYRCQYFTTPEFNRLVARYPAAAQEADKRCSR